MNKLKKEMLTYSKRIETLNKKIASGKLPANEVVKYKEEVKLTEKQLKNVKDRIDAFANSEFPTGEFRDAEKIIRDTAKKLEDLEYKMQKIASTEKVPTDEYKQLSQDVEKAEEQLAKLNEMKQTYRDIGVSEEMMPSSLQKQIRETEELISKCREEMVQLDQAGKAFTISDSGSKKLQHMQFDVDNLRKQLQAAKLDRQDLINSGEAFISGSEIIDMNTDPAMGKFAKLRIKAAETFAKIRSGAGKAVSGIKKIGSVTGKVITFFPRLLAKGISAFTGIRKHSNSAASGIGQIGSRILEMAKTVFVFNILRSALTALRSGIEESFGTYLTYDDALNNSINCLKASLNTLKGTLASAFAPIVSAVVPYLQTMMNWLVAAANAVAQFTAALMGKSSYKKASAGVASVGSAADSTAGSLGDAKDAAEELKKALGGYDELNVIGNDDTSSAGSGGGSGAGGSSGGELSYTDVDISSGISDFAEKVKEAWRNSDFTEIGTIVGTKLRDALDNIPWDVIKQGAKKIAKVTATFLNGFFETPGLFESVGNTVAQGLNTALTFAKTFLDTVHWDSIGTAITTGISSFFKNVDWSLLGGTISSSFIAFFDFVRGIFEGIDWSNLPQAIVQGIKDFFTGFDWKGTFSSFGELIGTVVASAIDLGKAIWEMLKNTGTNIAEYFIEYIKESFVKYGIDEDSGFLEIGAAIIKGVFNGIVDCLKNIGTWIKENILQPFVEGFKSAFDIHSPSKNPDILNLGKNIILGVLNGIIAGFKNIGTWVKKNILQPFLKAFKNAKDFFKDAGEVIWDGITSAFENIKEVLQVGVGLLKEGWTTVSEWVKDKIGGAVNKAIGIVRDGWTNIKDWISNNKTRWGGAVSKAIGIARSGWTTIRDWIVNNFFGGGIWKNIGVQKSGWESIKSWIESASNWGKGVWKNIGIQKSGWKSVYDWITNNKDRWGGGIWKNVGLRKAWKGTVEDWVKGYLTGGVMTVGVSLAKKADGGVYKNGSWSNIPQKAKGGILSHGLWMNIPAYAGGGAPHGTMFLAGEAGAEVVGNVGGRTEVLNKSQIASAIYSAVVAGMSEVAAKIGNAILTHMTDCTNAAIINLGNILSQLQYIGSNVSNAEYVLAGVPQISTQDANRYRYVDTYSGGSGVDVNAVAEAVANKLSANIQIENVMTLKGEPVYREMVRIDRETVHQTGKSGFGR